MLVCLMFLAGEVCESRHWPTEGRAAVWSSRHWQDVMCASRR